MTARRTHWRSFYLCLCAIIVAGTVMVLVLPRLAGLFLLGLYCIPTNSIFPLPHEPGVLYFAQFYDPLWIAIAATVASVIMSFADYAMVEAWMRHPRLGAVQHTRLFKWAVRWMKRWPFAIIVLFSLTPLPISVVRILAPASGYPVSRYIAAQIVKGDGRVMLHRLFHHAARHQFTFADQLGLQLLFFDFVQPVT